MNTFISHILLGISLAAPIGPINAAQIERGFNRGFWHSWLIGLGSITADILYMLAVFMGLVQFIEIPIVKAFLWLFGFFVLTYTGIESLLQASKSVELRKELSNSLTKSYLIGFMMSLTNPLTIMFWVGIYGSVLAKTAAMYEHTQLLLYSGSILLGLLIWDVCMAGASSFARGFLNNRTLQVISCISGLSLVGFGLYFGYEAYQLFFST
ncbi:LysE family transporter [Metabacillus sp. KIGAM252]|uniref:LysE family transporter n=1 Tax=Metabacillus flavus TaxID=2823519 RepID=A0ABS5LA31_9BACI|nr:LysE family transporter [Metabacillus flavus]MBS2967576.1 LysE family transporter [Metabacillus flavus]